MNNKRCEGQPPGTGQDSVDGGYRTRKGKRFQPSTIRGILSNRPFYEGKYKYGDMGWVQGVHTPLLPLEVK